VVHRLAELAVTGLAPSCDRGERVGGEVDRVTCLGQIAAPMILRRTVALTIVLLTAAERVA
jgi:hypothetical protein